jgi:hypothetical protein
MDLCFLVANGLFSLTDLIYGMFENNCKNLAVQKSHDLLTNVHEHCCEINQESPLNAPPLAVHTVLKSKISRVT